MYLNLTSNKLGVGGAWLLAQATLSETGFSLTLHHLDVSRVCAAAQHSKKHISLTTALAKMPLLPRWVTCSSLGQHL